MKWLCSQKLYLQQNSRFGHRTTVWPRPLSGRPGPPADTGPLKLSQLAAVLPQRLPDPRCGTVILHRCFFPSSRQLHSPSRIPSIRLLHPPLLAQVTYRRQVVSSQACSDCVRECALSIASWHYPCDCPLPLTLTWQNFHSGGQRSPCTCSQAMAHYSRETQHLTANVSLPSTEPLSAGSALASHFSSLPPSKTFRFTPPPLFYKPLQPPPSSRSLLTCLSTFTFFPPFKSLFTPDLTIL